MIGRLSGEVVEVEADAALLDVAGVGYVVRMGARTLDRLQSGLAVTAHIDTRWTEGDGPTLYGFLRADERAAFRALTAIQGVGPKAALAVLDILPPADLAAAAARDDKAAVGRANGVGPKLAVRIVTELKGKPLGGGLSVADVGLATPAAAASSVGGEATAALLGLGLAEPLARRAVDAAAARLGPGAALPALIKAALQESARS